MTRWTILFLISTTLFAAPSVHAQDNAIDEQAAEIAMNSARFLASQPAFSFGWFVSYDEVEDDGLKVTRLRSGNTLMARDKGFVAHTERDNTWRDYYWDGSVFSIVSPNEEFYASVEFTGDFDALVDAVETRTDSVLPMWSMMSKNLPDVVLNDVVAAAYMGTTLIAGQSAHHLIFVEPEEDWQIWISTDEDAPLPLLLVGTDKTSPGEPQYRVYMTDWNLEPDTDPAQFTYEPDENAVKVTFPLSETNSAEEQ